MRRKSIDVVQPVNYSPLLLHQARRQRSYSITPTDALPHFKQVTPASSHSSLKSRSNQQSREDVNSPSASPLMMRRSCLRRGSLGTPVLAGDWEFSSREIMRYRERPKTAFGSSVAHNIKPSPKVSRKKPKARIETPPEDTSSSSAESEPIRADDFINNCIIDSQTPRIKPPLRPKTSSLFSQLLDEFIPGSNDRETPELIEIAVTPRGRSNSFTAFQLHKPKIQLPTTAEQLEAA